MPVITLDRLADCPAAQWDALVPAQQPFLSYAFLSALEDSGSLGPGSGWRPQHLTWQENGKILAAIPATANVILMANTCLIRAGQMPVSVPVLPITRNGSARCRSAR
jgi:hypothetical protein